MNLREKVSLRAKIIGLTIFTIIYLSLGSLIHNYWCSALIGLLLAGLVAVCIEEGNGPKVRPSRNQPYTPPCKDNSIVHPYVPGERLSRRSCDVS